MHGPLVQWSASGSRGRAHAGTEEKDVEERYYNSMRNKLARHDIDRANLSSQGNIPKLVSAIDSILTIALTHPAPDKDTILRAVAGINRALGEAMSKGAVVDGGFMLRIWSRAANDITAEFMNGKLDSSPAALVDVLREKYSGSAEFVKEMDGLRVLIEASERFRQPKQKHDGKLRR